MIRSIIAKIAVVLIGILVVLLGRGLFFYDAFNIYSAAPIDLPSFEYVVVPAAPSTEFSDVYEEGEGIILIDLAHDNAFDKEELNVLTLRLVSRGLTIEFLKEKGELEKKLLGKEEEKVGEEENLEEKQLEEELPVADVFIVVCPREEFSKDDRETVDEFVNNGGKLLLITDPTRRGEMNSLSIRFRLIFEPDYLYNLKEYDANYRNIFITEFREN